MSECENSRELRFIPSRNCERKHEPTADDVRLREVDLKEYRAKNKEFDNEIDEYDFNRGWEYGFGEAIKLLRRQP